MQELSLLGTPEYRAIDGTYELPSELGTSLLAYLASRDAWTDRGELAALFWPDQPEAAARHSLSQLLYRSRKRPWFLAVEIEPQRVRFNGTSDLARFRHALAAGNWEGAAKEFTGNLLEGISPRDHGEFGTWLELEREELLATWIDAVSSHAAELSTAGNTDAAALLLQRVLQVDPLAEGVLQQYLSVARFSGARQAAANAYRLFRQQLADELGMEPLAETIQLAAGLLESAVESSPLARTPVLLRGAPAQLGSFIGRELELAQVSSQLQDQGARLLTILGPGGVGKTRLALQAGQQLSSGYDQAGFVPLAPLNSPSALPAALSAALGVDRAGPEAWGDISLALQDRRTLLVIDNFEHLLAAAPAVGRLLETAPGLQVIATSRAPLALRGELLFELDGLALPGGPADEQFLDFGAVQFFAHSARRLVPELESGRTSREAIYRIVHVLGGLPLGIELAVPWLRLLEPAELAAELEDSFDLLQAQEGSDLPERQRSLAAAFEHSWKLLDAGQRSCLARLAVFRGRFDRQAAEQVAGTGLPDLLALLDKSFLQRAPGGLFELHPPARRYAEGKQTDPAAVRRAHANHLVGIATEAEQQMHGSGQQEWLNRLDRDRADFLAAVDWAVQAGEATLGLQIACALQPLWWIRGPYEEGATLLLQLTALPAARESPLLPKGLHRAGTLLQELPEHTRLAQLYERALAGAREAGDRVLEADVIHSQAYRLDRTGELEAAAALYRSSLELYRQTSFRSGESASLNSLAVVLAKQRRFEEARPLLEDSLSQKQQLGQLQGVSYALHNLGLLLHELGEPEAGNLRLQESIELKRRLGDTRGALVSYLQAAVYSLEQGEASRAADLIMAGLEDARQIGHLFSQLQFMVLTVCLGAQYFPEVASRLAGGLAALSERHGLELLYGEMYSEALEQLSFGLGDAAFAAARLQGTVLTSAQLQELAVGALKGRATSS